MCRRCGGRLVEHFEQLANFCTMCWSDDLEKIECDRLQSMLLQRRQAHTLPDGSARGRL